MNDKDNEARTSEPQAVEEESDTEGHGMLNDPGLTQQLSRSRAAEVDRAARDRQRRNEVQKPQNRRG